MKKFLALLLALIMCVGVLASCGNNNNSNDDAAGATLDDEKELLNSMMKDDNGKSTPNDYNVVAKLTIGETSFDVTWATDNANITVKAAEKAGFWTVDVPSVNTAEVTYKLTATIKAADGSTVKVDFTRKLPVIDNAGVETEFKAGVAYTMFMKQANLGYTVYALNTTQNGENKYIETTMDPKEAAVYYVEVVDGGYKIYTEIDGVKNYLHAELKEVDGGKVSKYIGLKADSTCVFTYDKELAVFKIKLNGTEYGVGTYNSFKTISLSEASYFKADNINVEGGQFPIGLMTKEHADTLAPSVEPENNDPAADSVLTIADAIALGNSKANSIYTESKYYVSGTIKEIQNDVYGNIVITDGTNEILVYGTYSADGAIKFGDLDAKPEVGATVKVYGVVGKYSDKAQMKNAWIVEGIPEAEAPDHTCVDANNDFACDEADCDKAVEPAADSVLTLEQANALGVLMGSKTTANKYYVVGTVKSVYSTTYGNMYIKDANGVELTIYGTYNVDGTVRYDAMENKPVAGDTVRLYGQITSYNGVAQMKNGWVIELTAHGDNHTYADGKCTICGADQPVAGVTVENFAIAANAGALSNDNTTITWTTDNFTFEGNKAGSTSAIRTSDADHFRIYKSSTFAITAKNDKKISKIVITSTAEQYATPFAESITGTGVTVTVEGTTVTIEFAEAVSSLSFTASAQVRIASFAISYVD